MKKELTPEQKSRIRFILETVQSTHRTPGIKISMTGPDWDRLEQERVKKLDEATYSHLKERLEDVINPPFDK